MLFYAGARSLGSPSPSAPTYNGVPMTRARESTFGGFAWAAVYYLKNPALGANTLNVTASVATGMAISAFCGGAPPDTVVLQTFAYSNGTNDLFSTSFSSFGDSVMGVFAGQKSNGATWTGLDDQYDTGNQSTGYEVGTSPNGTFGQGGLDGWIIGAAFVADVGVIAPSGGRWWFFKNLDRIFQRGKIQRDGLWTPKPEILIPTKTEVRGLLAA